MLRKNILVSSIVILALATIVGCGDEKKVTTGAEFKVERVIDGGTVVLEGDRTVRYIGINTPEKDEPYYEESTEANRSLVEGRKVRLEMDEQEKDRYGRILAYVYVDDVFVNVELVRNGYARAYLYPPNVKHQALFSSAEEEAREESMGIWSSGSLDSGIRILKVNYDAEGDDGDNLNDEWVVIINNSDSSVSMAGYTLSDDSDHVYIFGNLIMAAGRTVTVFSGWGEDNPVALYWKSSEPVWNNDSDTVYLKDAGGETIDKYSY